MLTGTYRFPPMESVVYGRPFAETLREQVEQSGANSVFLLASGTLNRDTDMVGQVRQALGNRLAGVFARIGAHTPRVDVVEAANAARAAGADLLVTLGGGSVTDAAKMVAFCLGNDVADPAQLDEHRNRVGADGQVVRPQSKPPAVRTVAIPTTLVGRRIHRFGRLHRYGAQRQGELQPSADDAEIGRARSARDACTRRNGCSCRPASAPSITRSRTSARRNASRSRKARRFTRCGCSAAGSRG